MPLSALGATFFLLLGLFSAWVGVYMAHPGRSAVYDCDGQLQRRTSPTEMRLWLIAWMTMGLGWVCLGVTILRYANGHNVSVPTSAPLIYHLI